MGDFRIADILPRIERYFGGWQPNNLCLPDLSKTCSADRATREVHHDAGPAAQYLSWASWRRTDESGLLCAAGSGYDFGRGAGFTARIPQRLRDEMGLAYTTFASITMTAGLDPGRFIAFIGTSPENMNSATEGFNTDRALRRRRLD